MAGSSVKFDKSGLTNLVRRLQNLQMTTIEFGFFEDKVYGPENGNLPVAAVAAMNEYGTIYNPTRPFFQTTLDQIRRGWLPQQLASIVTKVIYKETWNVEMRVVGRQLVNQLRQTIEEWDTPRNSARTVARKGFDNPLIDSGVMKESVDSRIVKVNHAQPTISPN